VIYEKRNIRVLPDDTDAFGRLNWIAYIRYCEEGEAGLMETLGFSPMFFYRRFKMSFPRRAAVFEYLSPVSPDSFIDLETKVEKVGRTSLTLSHAFYRKNHEEDERILAAKARITIVAFDEQTNQKTDMPVLLTDSLRRSKVKIGV
jgi:YbgC/YbaW family acyl-CoA thioester hydrolase